MIEAFRRFEPPERPVRSTEPLRRELESHVEDFLDSGGEIDYCPPAASGWEGKRHDMGFLLMLPGSLPKRSH